MQAFIRKSSAAFFLLLGLSPLLVTFSFAVKEMMIQHRMKKMLESHALQTVTVAEKEVIWMDDHEIWVNGSMFDIRTKKLENGVYSFTGMYDADETLLVKQQQGSTHKLAAAERTEMKLLPCFHHLYSESHPEDFTPDPGIKELTSFILLEKSQFTPSILTPPPRIGHSFN